MEEGGWGKWTDEEGEDWKRLLQYNAYLLIFFSEYNATFLSSTVNFSSF